MRPGELCFKSKDVYISQVTHRQAEKLAEIEFWIIANYGMMVTCAYRDKKHEHDLHGTFPVRAKDIRSWCYEDPETVVKAINNRWLYDPMRPNKLVAFYHDSGSGKHIHLQIHPNTRLRE